MEVKKEAAARDQNEIFSKSCRWKPQNVSVELRMIHMGLVKIHPKAGVLSHSLIAPRFFDKFKDRVSSDYTGK